MTQPLSQTNDREILLKAWEIMQSLVKYQGEIAWKIRLFGLTLWTAIMAYSFKEKAPEISLIALMAVVASLIFEVAARQVQYKYIERSIEIERNINDILIGDNPNLGEKGISTNIDTPDIKEFFSFFRLKRWSIWLPYLLLCLIALAHCKIA